MGQELKCRVDYGGKSSEGKALLETGEIVFRGDFKLKIPRAAITNLTASAGELRVVFTDGEAVFHLGPAAAKWADRFLHPPSRLEKLGVKAGVKIALIGAFEEDFERELAARGAVTVDDRAEIVFLAANTKAALAKAPRIASGAVWVVYPKGIQAITENDVLSWGRAAGLKDIKVASFSETHTALKFTPPRK